MSQQSPTKPVVLYVDDEQENLDNFRILFRNDYRIHIAISSREADEILSREPIEVLIADHRMPVETGVELLARIREAYPAVMRMIMTGYSDFEAIIDAVNDSKIYHYFQKPIDVQEVRLVVGNAVDHLRLKRQLELSRERFEALFRLSEMTHESDQALLQHAIAASARITGSTMGCIACYDLDSGELKQRVACNSSAADGQQECTCDTPVILADEALRKKQVIVHDPIAASSANSRRLDLPILDGDQVVMLVKVCNKSAAYNKQDIQQLELMMTAVWRILRRRQVEKELQMYQEHLEGLVKIRTDELQKAKRVAELANHAKSMFLASMSHELRTPLNSVLGFTQLMLRAQSLSTEHRSFLKIIDRSGIHLLSLINDVLDVAKMEAGAHTLEPVDFNLTEMLKDLESLFSERADMKGIELVVATPAEDCFLLGDDRKIRQVLINLLGNAVKFTEHGSVELRISLPTKQVPQLVFEIVDSGLGIPPEDFDTVFKPFAQSESGKNIGGTGLGLQISRTYARFMGGDVTVSSKLGSGSHFTFSCDAAPGNAPIHAPEVEIGEVIGLTKNTPLKRVLVVDDDDGSRQFPVILLRAIGFEVQEAEDGYAALEICQSGLPDLVLMDIRMPGIDGVETTHRIQNMPGAAELPIVAMTGSVMEERRRELETDEGFAGVLLKPVRAEKILQVVGEKLGVTYYYNEADASLVADHSRVAKLTSSAEPGPGQQDQQPFVLVVDDLLVNQQLIAEQLETLGCRFEIVDNGDAALARWKALENCRWLLTDCMMPGMNGMELAREIRKIESDTDHPRSTIIAFTGSPEEHTKECIASGIDDIIGKPLSIEALHGALQKAGAFESLD